MKRDEIAFDQIDLDEWASTHSEDDLLDGQNASASSLEESASSKSSDSDDDPDKFKTGVLDHLTELRQRVIYLLIGFVLLFAISWNYSRDVFNLLIWPLQEGAARANLNLDVAQMNHLDLTEPFFVLLKTALFMAIFLSAPLLFYHAYRFVAPGLYKHERRMILPVLILSTTFFIIGAAFCFFFVMPMGYEFLLKFSENLSEPELQMRQYLDLTTKFLLAFGFIFELPVVTLLLSSIGLVTHRHLIKYARYAIVIAFLAAALLTPPDVITQTMMAVPLCLLYGISIGIAWIFTKSRERRLGKIDPA